MLQRSERKDAARHRELILNTANKLFNLHGVDSVSMHQIAKSAGIGQGTLYRRYSSKGDLCAELLMDSFHRFKAEVESCLNAMEQHSVHERMKTLFAKLIDYMADNIHWLNALKPAAFCQEDRGKFYTSPPCAFLTDLISSLLDEAVLRGDIPSLDTSFAAFNIMAALNPDAFLYLLEERGYPVEQIKAQYIALYVDLIFVKL
jgi:AcrR family transcriptional regulator